MKDYEIPVFTKLAPSSPDRPSITSRELQRELKRGTLAADQINDELQITKQHLNYHRTLQARLEHEMRDMTRTYQLRLAELGQEIGEAQRMIDELTIIRHRLYDRARHNRKKEDGREHPPTGSETTESTRVTGTEEEKEGRGDTET